MDDTIDGGPIISRVKIPFSKDLDVSLMYQLSFLAEKKVFHESFKENFVAKINHEEGDWIYYSRNLTIKLLILMKIQKKLFKE